MKYPLANIAGVVAFAEMLEADQVWRAMTKRQHALVVDLCATLGATAERVRIDMMPTLPPDTRSSTRGSMVNAGLVDEFGRLTFKAVHAWFWTQEFGSDGAS